MVLVPPLWYTLLRNKGKQGNQGSGTGHTDWGQVHITVRVPLRTSCCILLLHTQYWCAIWHSF